MNIRYTYKALDLNGKNLEGHMEAASVEEVGNWLTDRKYFVLEIAPASFQILVASSKSKYRIKTQVMNFFLLQLASLINAGCPLLMSLNALYRQTPVGDLKDLLKDLREKIESGKSFSESLKKHRSVFSNLFITMVEVGEVGGILGTVLERYATIHDTMYRIKSKIIQSMIYPAILLFMTIFVSYALLTYVLPSFIEKLNMNDEALPYITQKVMSISRFITSNSILLVSLVVLFIISIIFTHKSVAGKYMLDKLLLAIPMLGGVLKQMQLALFARILGTLLKSGVPILTSLQAVEKALGNSVFREALGNIREAVSRGESLTQSIGKHRVLFPESIILMTDVGEHSGNTGEMLEKAGVIYERELEMLIETFVSLLTPVLVIIMSIFIVILAISMYLPLFDIIKIVR